MMEVSLAVPRAHVVVEHLRGGGEGGEFNGDLLKLLFEVMMEVSIAVARTHVVVAHLTRDWRYNNY
jgi:hypothetical protein